MSEHTVGVRELKAELSYYLRQVKAGHVVIITEHGKPVGRLMPLDDTASARLKALVQAGIGEWNGEPLAALEPVVDWPGGLSLAELVMQDRE